MCVCVFSSHSFWTSSSLDVPTGVTQEEGHTGFFIHLSSAVRALIVFARRVQPFLSLVDRQVEFLCTNDFIVLHSLGIFIFSFLFFSEKNPVYRNRTHVPTCQKVTRLSLSYRGDRCIGGIPSLWRSPYTAASPLWHSSVPPAQRPYPPLALRRTLPPLQ